MISSMYCDDKGNRNLYLSLPQGFKGAEPGLKLFEKDQTRMVYDTFFFTGKIHHFLIDIYKNENVQLTEGKP